MQKFDLSIVEFFQSFSNDFLDFFFKTITHIGDEVIFLVVAAIIFWTVDKKFAFKFAIIYIFSALFNTLAKLIVNRPRPYTYPSVESIGAETSGTSFPSGHSQASGVLSYSLYKLNNNKYKWLNITCILIAILVPLSRVYLGQHFISDVIVGLLLGSVIAYFIFKLFEKIGDKEHLIGIYLVPAFLIALFVRHHYVYVAGGGFVGFAVGYYIEKLYVKHDVNTSFLNKVLKVILGLVVALAIKEGLKLILPDVLFTDFLRYLLIGVWVALGAPWVFTHVFKDRKKEV